MSTELILPRATQAPILPAVFAGSAKAERRFWEFFTIIKQNLAAIRMLFDWLVVRHVIRLNPAHGVLEPNHKPPILPAEEARTLLASMDTDRVIGRIARALLIGVFVRQRERCASNARGRLLYAGRHVWVNLHEKRGNPFPALPSQSGCLFGGIYHCGRNHYGVKKGHCFIGWQLALKELTANTLWQQEPIG